MEIGRDEITVYIKESTTKSAPVFIPVMSNCEN